MRSDRLAQARRVADQEPVAQRRLPVRERPDAGSARLRTVAQGKEVTVVARAKDLDGTRWAKLAGGGFVRADRLVVVTDVVPTTAVVERDLNVRTGPGVEYERTGWEEAATSVAVQARADEWVQIDGGGWVNDAYLDLPAEGPVELPDGEMGDVVAIAEQYLGTPYVWGGSTPETGMDCSGLVAYVYAQIGIDLPHYSGDIRELGTEIDRSEAQPGDIIWTPGHVAIYAGDNRQIEAARGQWGETGLHEIWQDDPVFLRLAGA